MSRAAIAVLRIGDALATAVATYGIPLLVLTTTGSSTLTGVAFVVEWVPRLTAYAVGGPAVDRFRTTVLLRVATWMRAALMAAAAVTLTVTPSGTPATAVVLATGATSALLGQVTFMGTEALGADLTRQAHDGGHRIQAWRVGIDQGALLAAPLLGGLLLLAGPAALLSTAAALSAATALTTHLVRDVGGNSPGERRRTVWEGLATGCRTVRTIPALAWLVTGLIASNFAVAVFQASSPIILLHAFGRDSVQTGAVWSLAGVAALGTVSLCGHAIDRWGLWPIGALAAGAACLACLTAASAVNFPIYVVSVAVLMGAEGATTVVLRTLRARLIPADRFGVTLAATAVLVIAPMPAAGLIVVAVPASALTALLLTAAALQAGVMTASLIGLWRHRATYTPPTPPVRQPASAPHPRRHPHLRHRPQHHAPPHTRHLEGTR
ncbi:MFS transporter [Streptomyces noursei]|uniref:MFS transporter n=1 Tax=Streptomyces noursei TaxID=1971 RepID=UPI000C9C1A87|nr:MFS transporter [Streptomyces noursei]